MARANVQLSFLERNKHWDDCQGSEIRKMLVGVSSVLLFFINLFSPLYIFLLMCIPEPVPFLLRYNLMPMEHLPGTLFRKQTGRKSYARFSAVCPQIVRGHAHRTGCFDSSSQWLSERAESWLWQTKAHLAKVKSCGSRVLAKIRPPETGYLILLCEAPHMHAHAHVHTDTHKHTRTHSHTHTLVFGVCVCFFFFNLLDD